ncbi:MAG TPA: folylpolyglutamate synthase/dihydrofolate synthase family protein [Vicinamibacteria bacterium]
MALPTMARFSAARYLDQRTQFGIKFGLGTMRALKASLGHPERAYPTLLVAGTNGKGSVTAYVDAALRASGLRVGRYTSPHLVRVNERIVVDGREIGARALDAAVGRVRAAAQRLVREGVLQAHPTYFEALTAAAFDHFRRQRVDVAVLEVGMGGRLDATNVSEPVASAIVSVARDHEAYLGHTLAAIAREKAGVLRRGRVAVLGPLPASARQAVAAVARSRGARLRHAFAGSAVEAEGPGRLTVRTPERTYRGLQPLPGAHQQANLLVALRLIEAAREADVPVNLQAVPAGIAETRWPGRLQWVAGSPPLLLDGAHNPAGAQALAEHLRSYPRHVLLFGAMSDKHVAAMARVLFPAAHAIVLTRAPGARAADPDQLAERAGRLAARAHRESDPRRALELARRLAPRGAPVVVAGSLYLVGEVLRRLGPRARASRTTSTAPASGRKRSS